MHHIKINHLFEILKDSDQLVEDNFNLAVNPDYIKGKGEALLREALESLGASVKSVPLLENLKFDFKINRHVFLYDDEVHFNRYRLNTLKTEVYESFTYSWIDAYKRMCRTFERDCLKAGLQERIWHGPPIARTIFGKSEEAGDLSGNGSAGWKLNAYNDCQYDLVSRLHGYKLIRIPVYENIMTGGSLKKIDDLLLKPKEETYPAIKNWFFRKLQ